jgi:uncharacterized caspase-like protein
LYYAGHGLQSNGENYLLPVDAAIERPSDLDLEAQKLDYAINAIALQGVTAILFLDACRDNPFVDRILSSDAASRGLSVSRGMAPIQAGRGIFVGFATQPGNVAYDGTEDNSPFAKAFLRNVETPDIDIEVVMRRVRMDVMNETHGKQVPWSNSSLVEPGFSFVPGNGTGGPVSAPSGASAADIEFWNSVKEASEIKLYRAYLAAFPLGMFADQAKESIAKLEKAVPKKQKRSRSPAIKKAQSALSPSSRTVAQPPRSSQSTGPGVTQATVSRTGGRCRDGNLERCRQKCSHGHNGACFALKYFQEHQ